MNEPQRINFRVQGNDLIVSFEDTKLIDPSSIDEMGNELLALEEVIREQSIARMILSFEGVDFFSSGALGQFLLIQQKARELGVRIMVHDLRPELLEVFKITHIDRFFDFDENDADDPQGS